MRSLMLQVMGSTSAAQRSVNFETVTRNYFRTVGSRFVRGGTYSSPALIGRISEVVISQALERELWQKRSALGRTVRLTAPGTGVVLTTTVVGVVADMRFSGPQATPRPTVFLPLRGLAFTMGLPYIVVNGTIGPEAMQAVVNRELATLSPPLKARGAFSIGARAQHLMMRERWRERWTIAGAITIALAACIGLFGMLNYAVSVRQRELALRICFGASPWAIRQIVLRQTAICSSVAAALATPAWLVFRAMASENLLGQMKWSPVLAGIVTLSCIAGTLLMSLMPAAVATRIPPANVLKSL